MVSSSRNQPADSTGVPYQLALGANCISRVPFLLAWLPALVAILYLKFVSLQLHSQFGFDFWMLPLLQKLSIFRGDILVCFCLIPLGLLLWTLVLPRQLRGAVVALFSIVWLFISFANVKSIAQIGRLYSFNLVWDSLHWVRADPRAMRAYLGLGSVIRVVTLMALTTAIAWWASKQSAAIQQQASVRRRWVRATRVAALPLAALIVLPWLSGVASNPSTRSVLISSIQSFVGWEEQEQSASFQHLGPVELMSKYRELAHIDVSTKDYRYWSQAKDSDVIVFVFETGPAQVLPIDGNLDDFPNLRMLRDRSFVAPKHYSTYPFTDRALFSCLGGWYPADFMKDFSQIFHDLEVPGMARELSNSGYKTTFYSPFPFPWQADYDLGTTRALGFERLSFAHASTSVIYNDQPWKAKRSYDLDSLQQLESDVEGWLNQGQRYMVVFAPQLGHGPWFDVTPDGQLKNVMARGRPLMALQDAYLGEILKLLAAHHRLDKTLIVVTGDHGARTLSEDPDLAVGMIDDISYHVPMLIYAPQLLKTSVTIPWLTSHIDISPTVLDLMGVNRRRDLEQGSPIWDPALQWRTTFFFARHYFSADGYHANGQFVMWNQFFDKVYENSQMHFAAANAVPPGSPLHRHAIDSIQGMVNMQERWVEVFGHGDSPVQVTSKH